MTVTVGVNLKPLIDCTQIECLARTVIKISRGAVGTAYNGPSAFVVIGTEGDGIAGVRRRCEYQGRGSNPRCEKARCAKSRARNRFADRSSQVIPLLF